MDVKFQSIKYRKIFKLFLGTLPHPFGTGNNPWKFLNSPLAKTKHAYLFLLRPINEQLVFHFKGSCSWYWWVMSSPETYLNGFPTITKKMLILKFYPIPRWVRGVPGDKIAREKGGEPLPSFYAQRFHTQWLRNIKLHEGLIALYQCNTTALTNLINFFSDYLSWLLQYFWCSWRW